MSQARFVKFVKGRYWVTITETAEHPYKVFQDRHEAKVWLVEHGVLRVGRGELLARGSRGHIDPCAAVRGLTSERQTSGSG
jgi:hypothetical protein